MVLLKMIFHSRKGENDQKITENQRDSIENSVRNESALRFLIYFYSISSEMR